MDHANYFEQFSIDYCYVEIFAPARSVFYFVPWECETGS